MRGTVLYRASSFVLFFMVEVWELLMQDINTYAARTGAPSGWYDTSVEDMKTFIGMLIIIGISKLHTLAMYWSTNNSELVPTPSPIDLYR